MVGVVGHRGRGLDALRALLADPTHWSTPPVLPPEDRAERAGWAASIAESVIGSPPARHDLTERIDRVVLHPLWGSLLFGV